MHLQETLELIEFANEHGMLRNPFHEVINAWLRFKAMPLYVAEENIRKGLEDE